MSHGVERDILGVQHSNAVPDKFPINNIYKHLDLARCPKLLNKPKVIIINACRGGVLGFLFRFEHTITINLFYHITF